MATIYIEVVDSPFPVPNANRVHYVEVEPFPNPTSIYTITLNGVVTTYTGVKLETIPANTACYVTLKLDGSPLRVTV
ncbi:hypothetical protein [Plasticicumulans acidivorans]|uniref:Uncharacterized protein n=1 Tax=Plasticicumulans acidivorans TaxID=886464 RepID=A0A317MZU6_9GAMM|nr:hypothetical protein [Plasticicumulans acidivorans]PWV64921.1 hypothetical protein C7443_102575 [Plasticicumulans acidivorans]